MRFEHFPDDGDGIGAYYAADWPDHVTLYLKVLKRDDLRLYVEVRAADNRDTLLAGTVVDANRAQDRRSIAQSILHDAADWPARVEDAFEQLHTHLARQAGAASDAPMFIWAHELSALPDPECVIDGLMQRESLGVIVGGPEAMKSITLLDMAGCIGSGAPWHGRGVQQGFVVYVYAEGVAGLKWRAEAWEEANQRAMENVAFVPYAIPLLDEAAVANLLAHVTEDLPHPPMAVFIDTLARAMAGGDENATADMGRLIGAADLIKRKTRAAVWLAHHNNKLGEYRGNTALLAGVDTAAAIERRSDTVTITCLKSKDMEPFAPIELVRTQVGRSVVLASETPESKVTRLQNNLSPSARELIDALQGFPEGAKFHEWVAASGKPKGGSFQRPHDELKAAQVVVNEFGKWRLVPRFQTVPNAPGTSGERERFHSSTTPVGGGTGTTFPDPTEPSPATEGVNGSKPTCLACGLFLDERFAIAGAHSSCVPNGARQTSTATT